MKTLHIGLLNTIVFGKMVEMITNIYEQTHEKMRRNTKNLKIDLKTRKKT